MTKRKFLRRVLDDFFIFLGFCLFLGLATAYFRQGAAVYILCAGVFIFLFIVRQEAKNIFIFSFLSLLPLVLVLFLKDLYAVINFTCYCTAAVIYSFHKRLNASAVTGGVHRAVFPLVCAFICMVINHYAKIALPGTFFILHAALAVTAAAVITHITSVDICLNNMVYGTRQPFDEIKAFNNRAIILFALVLGLAVYLSSFIRLEFILPYLAGALISAVRFIVMILNKIFPEAPVEEPAEAPVEDAGGDMGQLAPGAPNVIFVILEKFMVMLAYALFYIAIFAFIGWALYTLYKKFYAKIPEADTITDTAPPDVAARKKGAAFKRFASLFWGRSKSARIRKLFYKKVKKYRLFGVKPKGCDTAQDISKEVSQYEDITALTELYEKARYFE